MLIKVIGILAILQMIFVDSSATPFGPRGEGEEKELPVDEIILNTMGGGKVAEYVAHVNNGEILSELDMLLSAEQFANLYETSATSRRKRKASRFIRRWTRATVPYIFNKDDFNAREKYFIERAMTEWERYTCVQFRPKERSDSNYVNFQDGEGCRARVGMASGQQPIILQSGCRKRSTYLHEIGHALGLQHEHQRPDRDQYIIVNTSNAEPSNRIWFRKYSIWSVNTYNVEYQHSSVMHYGVRAFSKDRVSQTIKARAPYTDADIDDGLFADLSFGDVKIVNLMYQCGSHCSADITCSDGGYVDQNCRCVCPDGTGDCLVRTGSGDTASGGTNQDESCTNVYNDWGCYIWANMGDCAHWKFTRWMNRNCRKACGVCGSTQQSAISATCTDEFRTERCRVWKERGDCNTNVAWMTKNCKQTCNFCDSSSKAEINCENKESIALCQRYAMEGKCSHMRDDMISQCAQRCRLCSESQQGTDTDTVCGNIYSDQSCDNWARLQQCRFAKDFMEKNCKKSCKKCDSIPDSNDGVQYPCKDNHTWCPRWADSSYCERTVYAKFMLKTCRRSCNNCEANCQDLDTMCPTWGNQGQCASNPAFMSKNCQKTCGVCLE